MYFSSFYVSANLVVFALLCVRKQLANSYLFRLSSPENTSNSNVPVSPRPSSSPSNAPSDAASTSNTLLETAKLDTALPETTLSDDALPVDASQEAPSQEALSQEAPSPDTSSPYYTPVNNALPDHVSSWRNPLSYGTTLLLAAASLALYTILPRLPKEKFAQIMGQKDKVTQVPAPTPEGSAASAIAPDSGAGVAVSRVSTSDIARVLPGRDDIIELSKKTSESVSRYTAAALSRYTTKSRTVVSTSNINHDETSVSFSSSQLDIENSKTTPEELEIE